MDLTSDNSTNQPIQGPYVGPSMPMPNYQPAGQVYVDGGQILNPNTAPLIPTVPQIMPGQPMQPMMQLPNMPVPQMQPSAAAPAPAFDNELEDVDKEWADKAKEVIYQTSHDPFTQSKELSKLKAGYLKLRYNKQFKLAEDP